MVSGPNFEDRLVLKGCALVKYFEGCAFYRGRLPNQHAQSKDYLGALWERCPVGKKVATALAWRAAPRLLEASRIVEMQPNYSRTPSISATRSYGPSTLYLEVLKPIRKPCYKGLRGNVAGMKSGLPKHKVWKVVQIHRLSRGPRGSLHPFMM